MAQKFGVQRIHVVVTDVDTGEVLDDKTFSDDYMLICVGNRYLKSMQTWGSTHQLNVAVHKSTRAAKQEGEQ